MPDGYVMVSKNDLAQLATEITQLKQTLPKVLGKDVVKAVGQLPLLEEGKLTENLDMIAQTIEQNNPWILWNHLSAWIFRLPQHFSCLFTVKG